MERFAEAGILHPEAQGQPGQQFANKVVRNIRFKRICKEQQFAKMLSETTVRNKVFKNNNLQTKCKIFAWNNNLQTL